MRAEYIIIGGGVAGLTLGLALRKQNREVIIYNRDNPAAASFGIVGALSPYYPDDWSFKKQYQFEALLMQPSYWQDVEKLSGLSSSYEKKGRWQNITSKAGLVVAKARAEKARKYHWLDLAKWEIQEGHDMPFNFSPFGVIYDDLSAQIDPRIAMKALKQAYLNIGGEYQNNEISLVEAVEYSSVAIVAAGYESFSMVENYFEKPVGEGEKGQAAILEIDDQWDYPLIMGNGMYLVGRGNRVSLGSTKERFWNDIGVDDKLDVLIDKAQSDFPLLSEARIVETWAGIRPRGIRPDPILHQLSENLWLYTGGFGIGFGLSPKLSEDFVSRLLIGQEIPFTLKTT